MIINVRDLYKEILHPRDAPRDFTYTADRNDVNTLTSSSASILLLPESRYFKNSRQY